jgi:nitrate/nitrite-specific signal transduction histidine kinase
VSSRMEWNSLQTKIIAWSFVPTAVILFAVAVVIFIAYRQVTEDLVIERNQELTRLSAGQLATELSGHTDLLDAEARMADIYQGSPATQRAALLQASNRLSVFDGGVIILDTFGTVVAAVPERPETLGQDWSDRAYFRQMLRSPGSEPIFSDIVTDGPGGAEVVVAAVPITGERGEFLGVMAGMFRLGATSVSAFYGDIVKLRIDVNCCAYLVDGNGRVIYHSELNNIGDDYSAQVAVRQAQNGLTGAIRTRDAAGLDAVASFAPVPGTTWALVTEENWTGLVSASQGYRRFLFVLLALGVVAPALVVAFGVKRITSPVEELIEAAQEVAGGSFGRRIRARTRDEIGELANQFNCMSAQLEESYASLEQRVSERTRELAALNTIASVVSRTLMLEKILTDALDKTLEVTGIEAGGIYLLQESTEALTIATHKGLSAQLVAEIDNLEVGEGFSGRVVETGEPLVVRELSTDSRLTRSAVQKDGFNSVAIAPLVSRGKVLGSLFVITRDSREFSQQDIDLITSIGGQIGVAVENARLFEQAQQLAVMEERQRLARDLHDSVTQALFGVTMYAEAATRLLSSGDSNGSKVVDHLRELQATAQEALREMRLLIFELRPPVLEEEGLVAALQARLDTVETRSGLEVELKVEGGGERLSHEIEAGLYRIAQEALNNVLKHAEAHRIAVCLRQDERSVTLEVADDGVGFDQATARRQGGLGLPGMEERAKEMGGHLLIESSPGEGTKVSVEVRR